MSTKLSAKLERMTPDNLAFEYAMMSAAGARASSMSSMGLCMWRLNEVLTRKVGKDRRDELVAQYSETIALVGIKKESPMGPVHNWMGPSRASVGPFQLCKSRYALEGFNLTLPDKGK